MIALYRRKEEKGMGDDGRGAFAPCWIRHCQGKKKDPLVGAITH